MPLEFKCSTDVKNVCTVDSRITKVSWLAPRGYAGQENQFTVQTLLVAEGSPVTITCKTGRGKKIDVVKGVINNNNYCGTILLPENLKPDDTVMLEAKLPKHKLSAESEEVPVHPFLQVSKLFWSKSEISRNSVVTLTCHFTSGVDDDDEVTVTIYEWKAAVGIRWRVTSFPAEVKNSAVVADYAFDYHDNIRQICTEEELARVNKHYQSPQYYFTVSRDGREIGTGRQSGLLTFYDFVYATITIGRMSTIPPATKLTLTYADGTEQTVAPDDKGTVAIDKAPPGRCWLKLVDAPNTNKDSVEITTGSSYDVLFPDMTPLFDMHMHTQSNNCCPLPLQWGILAGQAMGLLGRPSEKDRKNLNDSLSGIGGLVTGRFGKVGRMSTDLIGKLYLHDLSDLDMRQNLFWTVLSRHDMKSREFSVKKELEQRRIAGEKAELTSMNQVSVSMWQESFVKTTSRYFTGTDVARYSLTLLMDLSFSHYWGRLGLPVYLGCGNEVYYVNDYAAVAIQRDETGSAVAVKYVNSVVMPETKLPKNTLEPWEQKTIPAVLDSTIHLHARFFPNELQLCNDGRFYEYQYHLKNPGGAQYPVLRFTEKSSDVEKLLKKKYLHIVDEAKNEYCTSASISEGASDTDTRRFEGYAMQRELTVATMVAHPLAIFAAYHFDPRRHLLNGTTTVSTLAQEILEEHAFFTAAYNKNSVVQLSGDICYRGSIDLTPHPAFNRDKGMEQVLAQEQRSIEEALNELLMYPGSSGLFWAVKMYPRLGYSPSDIVNYPNLLQLYRACAANSIPVIAHCGASGMAVHDYYLYERYDGKAVKQRYDLNHAERLFDGTLPGSKSHDSPKQWEEVLRVTPKLKLCIAHFGGYSLWKEIGYFRRAAQKLAKRGNMHNPKVYDTLDNYRDWVVKIAELVTTYPNVYTDLACFTLDESYSTVEDTSDGYLTQTKDEGDRLVAANLFFLITTYPDLVDRICLGSDWYMSEMDDFLGLGEYMKRMFLTLRMVTERLVAAEKKGMCTLKPFDVWHQFSVVNPMRFLGLITEEKGTDGPFTVKMEMVERLGVRLGDRTGDTQWKRKYNLKIDMKLWSQQIKSKLSMFKKLVIPSSRNLIKNETFLILNE